MSARLILVAFAIGVIGLSIALFAPAAIDPVINDVSETTNVSEGGTVELSDTLQLTMEEVNQGADTINGTFLSTRTRNASTTGLIDEGNSTTVMIDGDNLTLSNDEVTGATTAVISATYPPLFGWADGPRTFVENLDLMMLVVVATLAIALAVAAVKYA